mmetsp:Transcript_108398/g.271695  ORF Transcript_108398/g.271695 Transcript_108398/m.271695 type:complete len:203 (-) Transcript_108398:597-1205(-)
MHATNMPMELHSINCRRPARSASKTAGKVERKFTKLLIVVKRFLLKPMLSKIFGPKYMKAFMPTSCCSNCSVTPKTQRLKTRPCSNSDHAGSPSSLAFSSSCWISNSSWTASSSARMERRTLRASSRLPVCTSQRGDRGKKIIPTSSPRAGMQMIPMTTRQPSVLSTKTWSMYAAMRMPKVMPNWYSVESAPRIEAGATSLW